MYKFICIQYPIFALLSKTHFEEHWNHEDEDEVGELQEGEDGSSKEQSKGSSNVAEKLGNCLGGDRGGLDEHGLVVEVELNNVLCF